MSGGKLCFNLFTSVVFGPAKYGYKLLREPDKRARNTAFFLTSLAGAGVLGDIIESVTESGTDVVDSIDTQTNHESLNSPFPHSSVEENSFVATISPNYLPEALVPTINQELLDSTHPETGVPFEINDAFHSELGEIKGVFPIFPSEVEIELTAEEFLLSDDEQFRIANEILLNNINWNQVTLEELGFTMQDLQVLKNGETPSDFVWHHHEEAGILQLVDREVHENTAHTGGRELWGGGEEYR
ncbi:HNH endonuclease [[Brevibacterium] frigoritolerans]|nr:HNH endonuclease [Peribacillus frigoritolerans]